MGALTDLENRLGQLTLDRYGNGPAYVQNKTLHSVCRELETRFKAGDNTVGTDDQILLSLQNFADTRELRLLRDARRVSYGLAKPISATQPSVFEDRQLFLAVLDGKHGVDRWRDQPRAFRRCYRGLTSSYFGFHGDNDEASKTARHNWHELRDYLYERNDCIALESLNPGWVDKATAHAEFFTDRPCSILGQKAFAGENEYVLEVLDELAINSSSWFHHDLLLSQVEHAVVLDDQEFENAIGHLIGLISDSIMVRDKALALLLNRYMQCVEPVEHTLLRDTTVNWWGNPWLPSTELRWGRVDQSVRDTIAQWLQKEFIDAFFGKLSSAGIGDERRAKFWSRYIGVFNDMHFGLGRDTLYSRDPDFRTLIEKMDGLYGPLEGPGGGNNAFIMTLGDLVVVEFGGESNALYCYDKTKGLPFIIDKHKPLCMPVDAPNSLKNKPPISEFKLIHQDTVHGYAHWENRFEDLFRNRFGIEPASQQRQSRRRRTRQNSRQRETTPVFDALVNRYGLTVKDLRSDGGNLWVRTDDSVQEVNSWLSYWGFQYKAGKGWWKKE